MRVDPAIMRQILQTLEEAPGPEVLRLPEMEGLSVEVERYHMQLLLDGGYVTGQQLNPYRPAFAVGLTIAGQRLLDEMRAAPGVAKTIGECAQRIVTGAAVALLTAKARSIGLIGLH